MSSSLCELVTSADDDRHLKTSDYMKQISYISIIILMLIRLATLGISQNTASTPESKDKVNLYRRYDKSKDQTVTKMEPILIYGAPSPVTGLYISASYTFTGKTPGRPESVNLLFRSGEGKYKYDRELIVKAEFFHQLFKAVRVTTGLDPHNHFPAELTVEGPDVVTFAM